MDGKRIQTYWSNEISALIATYNQFQTLIPSNDQDAAAHKGEDGRYVEDLLREYLRRYVPRDIEILTGFILRPAVKTGTKGRERQGEVDQHSTQLDIIVYDSANYPVLHRFGDSVIVPPEGVIAVISVKKHFNDKDIKKECAALGTVSRICRTLGTSEQKARGPYLALVAMNSKISKTKQDTHAWIFSEMKKAYSEDVLFDDLVGYVGSLNEWSIFKKRPPKDGRQGEYVLLKHRNDELHIGFQFLLTGIFSVYYDSTRNNRRRPGFTAFPSGRQHDCKIGNISCNGLR